MLSPLLAGTKRIQEIVTHPPEWYSRRGILIHDADAVIHIDRVRRCVRSRNGVEASYDRLLLATGSRPAVLAVSGSELPGVISFSRFKRRQCHVGCSKGRRARRGSGRGTARTGSG